MEDAEKRDYETADWILEDGQTQWYRQRIARALCVERETALASTRAKPCPDPIKPWYYPSADESRRA